MCSFSEYFSHLKLYVSVKLLRIRDKYWQDFEMDGIEFDYIATFLNVRNI